MGPSGGYGRRTVDIAVDQKDKVASSSEKLGFNGAWSMAVGGMVGGGIFSTLGVVIAIAGSWAWLSFAVAGLLALGAGYSYVKLAILYGKGGGSFTFLREINAKEFAGSLAWVLIIGYVLTNAVYAFTFGQYLGHVVGLGPWFPRVAAACIMLVFIGLNLRGVGDAGNVEIFLVWFKLAVLVGLATWGLLQWDPAMLSEGVADTGILMALFGAASVFMAYEGFQLLSYDYEDIESPQVTLPRSVLWAIVVVTVVYILVALGTALLIGADQIIANKEVALAIAGQKAMGTAGLILVTVGAAFSTGSAINSTLFATARLARDVAKAGELPDVLGHENNSGIPDRAVIGLGSMAILLAVAGSLTALVEAASLIFLFTFTVVCGLAYRARAGWRSITGVSTLAGIAASLTLIVRLIESDPLSIIMLALLILVAIFGRPLVLRHVKNP